MDRATEALAAPSPPTAPTGSVMLVAVSKRIFQQKMIQAERCRSLTTRTEATWKGLGNTTGDHEYPMNLKGGS